MDKIGDSLKEFTIRAVDLSSASQAVADLGLDYQRLAADIASGGDKADAAFRQVVTGLLGIKDPAKQANDAIQFFGSPLEDLGTAKVPEFLRQLNAAGKGLGDFSGAATDAADKVNTGASTSLSNFGRQLEQVGTRVGTGLLPVLEPALDGLDHLGSAVGVVADRFGEMPRPVQLTALGIGVLGAALTRNMRAIDASITGLARWKTGLTSLGKQLGVGGLIAYGVAAITDRMERAKEIQDSINGATKTWTDRLVETGGKWDNILRSQQEMDVMQSAQYKKLVSSGINGADIIAAAQGDVAKANQIYDQLNDKKSGLFESIFAAGPAGYIDSQVQDMQNWVQGLNQANYAAERNAQAVGVMNDAMKSAGSIAAGVATAVGQLAPQKSLTEKLFGPMQITAGIMSKSLATLSTKPLDRMALSLGTVQKNASEADTRLQYFSMTVDQLSGVTIDSDRITRMMNQAVRDLKDGFKAATDATDGNIESLIGVNGQIDTTTKAGADLFDTVSDYREAYDKATSSAYSNAVASGNQAGALKLAQKAGQDAYDQWMADAKALGINEGKAKDMATAAGILEAQKITDKNFAITAADRATGVLETVKKTLGSLPALTTLRVNVVAAGMDAAKAAVGAATSWITGKHALGGVIYGPGTGTSDSIPAWLSNGEYVVRASAARKHRGMLDAINYGAPGFADGGSVNIDLIGSGNASGATGPALASIAAMRSNVSQANATITAAAAAARAAAAAIGVGGSGVTRWAGVMTQALRMTGQYTPANLAAGLHQMQTESGGNPYAINNYDINAQRGDPSRGLMQTIMATFKSFAMPGYSGNIYDPLSNILASIRYTLARYGSLQNGWRGVAYAGGGLVQGPGSSTSDSIAAYLSNREFVVNAAATARHLPVLQAINSGATAASVPDVNLNVTVKIGERDITNIVDVQVDRGIQHFAQQLGHEVRLAKAQH